MRWRKQVMIAVLAIGIGAAAWHCRAPSQVAPPLGDVPYVPSRPPVVERMIEMLEVGPADLLYDLGSGDGRIVIRAAERFGARGLGVEIDPQLVAESRRNAASAGVDDRVTFVEGDLFETDVSPATALTLYLLPGVNLALRPKLLTELAAGTPLVSQTFDMAEWRPDRTDVVPVDPPASLYLWIVPAAVAGIWEVEFGPAPEGGAAVGGGQRSQSGSGGVAPRRATLRLMQSFQEVEGELSLEGEIIGVTGRLRGRSLQLEAAAGVEAAGSWRLVGEVDGGSIVGTLAIGDAASAALEARLVASRAEGVWEIESDAGGLVAGGSIGVDRSGDRWMARRWTDDPAAARPMRDFYVWAGGVYFVLGDEQGRRIAYRGVIDGDRVSGLVRVGDTILGPWAAHRTN